MLSEGRSGEVRTVSGTLKELRLGPYGEGVVNDVGLGRYFEATRQGRMFALSAIGFTVGAASFTPLAATTTPIVGIVNVSGSGKAAAIQRVTSQTRSGTPGGPFYLVASLTSGGITTGAAGTIVNTA